MKYTTLAKIRAKKPCAGGWIILLKYLDAKPSDDDRRISFRTILKSNGIEDAIWCLRTLPKQEVAPFSADVAESVLHIYEAKHPNDSRLRKAIEDTRKGVVDSDAIAYAARVAYAYAINAADYATDASDLVDYAADASDLAADVARKNKWQEIEKLFIKHYC